jgi:superfamily II helicase
MDGKLISLYHLITRDVPPDVVLKYLDSRFSKFKSIYNQKYDIAAKWRSIERDYIEEYPILEKFQTVITLTSMESTEAEIRNFQLDILLY